ncbi:hemagglutinin family protein (plasmid) [Burkholderia cepacia]|nr:hemagglutinin family protein [Burkholderia cepacia]
MASVSSLSTGVAGNAAALSSLSTSSAAALSSLSTSAGQAVTSLSASVGQSTVSLSSSVAGVQVAIASLSTGTANQIAALSTSTDASVSSLSTGVAGNATAVSSLSTSSAAAVSSLSTSTGQTLSALSASVGQSTVSLSSSVAGVQGAVASLSTGTANQISALSTSTVGSVISLSTSAASNATTLSSLSASTSGAVASLSTGIATGNVAIASLSTGTAAQFASMSTSAAQLITSLSTGAASQVVALSTATAQSVGSLSTGLNANAAAVGSLSTSTGAALAALASDAATTRASLSATTQSLFALSTGLSEGTLGLVQQVGGVGAGAITIGANTAGSAIDIAGTTGTRQIKGVAAGTSGTDAVNLQQLQQVAAQTGAIGSSAVTYDDATHTHVTLGGAGAAVPVTLTNVADGTLSTTSSDAVTGRQLYEAEQATNSNTTAIYTLAGATQASISSLSTGVTTTQSSMSTTMFGAVASLSTGLSGASSALTALQSGLAAGTIGIVQQTGVGSGAITIGAAAGGTAIDVAGTSGARQIKNVAAGTDAGDAVNLHQLENVSAAVGAIGANAVTYDDASHARVTLGVAGAPVTLTNVADAALTSSSTDAVSGRQLYAADQAISVNAGAIASLSTSTNQSVVSLSTGLAGTGNALTALQSGLAAGTIGIVQQAGGVGGGAITIGAAAGGTALDIAGTSGARQIRNVAAGTDAGDAVNLHQLENVSAAVGAIGANAVSYDDASHARVTFGSSGTPVTLTNVADAALTASSTDAVSGRQLYAADQAIASLSTSTSTNQSVVSLSTGLGSTGNALTALQSGLAAGTIGIVQQAGGTGGGAITIGAGTGGTAVDIAGTSGARQIKNVAAGTDAGDAVNLHQLENVSAAVGAIGANAVSYDDASHARVTFGSSGTPVTLTNVADAALTASSTDAVSGRQLYATNQSVSALAGQLAAGTVGLVQQAGAGKITIGATTGGKTVDVAGTDGARRLTGVAAGLDATDAVNVGQLNKLVGTVNTIAANALSYDDPTKLSVTLGGLGAGAAVTIHHLAAGDLSASSSDAVNGAQLFATNQLVAANTSQINAISARLGGILPSNLSQNRPVQPQGSLKYAAFNSTGDGASATGEDAVAIGGNAVATGDRSATLGVDSLATRTNTVAVGAGASATGANAVALGAGSVADRDNAVSIGNAATGMTRTLENVAPGVAPTDAVNVQQLGDSVTALGNQIEHDRRDASGGIASAIAIASLPQAPAPGKTMVAVGGGTYSGQTALAVGISTYAGRWVLKANGSTNSRGTIGAGFGAGYVW